MRIRFALLALLPLVTPFAVTAQTLPPGTQAQGELAGPGKAEVFAIRTADEWSRFLAAQRLNWNVQVNWTRDMVVGVFLGVRNTGGYKVEITDVQNNGLVNHVTYTEIPPGAGAMVTQAMTNPYVLRVIEASAQPVVFSHRHFSTAQVPYGEYVRMIKGMSETQYSLTGERRKNDRAQQRIEELETMLRQTSPAGAVPR
ncbi:MAG: protease complex subunit PrcB family protein [Alphaproteobacteria bacterium]|nr:protease complex subunit PrcB family protein [Alphaproteobacteria bacterium]